MIRMDDRVWYAGYEWTVDEAHGHPDHPVSCDLRRTVVVGPHRRFLDESVHRRRVPTDDLIVYADQGEYRLSAAMAEQYVPAMGEDGPYERRDTYPVVEATHDRGRKYCRCFDTLGEAIAFVRDLPDGFDPEDEAHGFAFVRTAYGSPDWSAEDEIAMMDDEERAAKGV